MELKIISKKEEPLLPRTEVKAEITFQGVTPSKKDLQKQIASSLKTDENFIVVKQIKTLFGQQKANVRALQYESEEALKKVEPKQKVKKAKTAAEQPAEAKK